MKRLAWLLALLIVCADVDAGPRYDAERAAFESCKPLKSGVSFASASGNFAAPDVLCIRGQIDPSLSLQAAHYLSRPNGLYKSLRYIVISGPGGQLRPAIAIAELIERVDATVVVGDICASACSQFLFVAGKRKVILSGGVVAFHGGPLSQENIEAITSDPRARASLGNEQQEFVRFYKERNLDMRMLTNPPMDVAERLAKGEFVMWSWRPDKLTEFGVSSVESEE